MRVINEELCDNLRHVTVHVSGIVPADCYRLWAAVREFGSISRWFPAAAEGSVLQVCCAACAVPCREVFCLSRCDCLAHPSSLDQIPKYM